MSCAAQTNGRLVPDRTGRPFLKIDLERAAAC
jgi:hypothetical protein